MDDKIFDSKEKQDEGVNAFKNLLRHRGWKLFVSIAENNIDVLKEQILSGVDNDGKKFTTEEIDRLRDTLISQIKIINIPGNIIKQFTDQEVVDPNPDPYETGEEENV